MDKRENLKVFIIFLILFIFAALMTSCSAKKTVQKFKQKTEIDSSAVVQVNTQKAENTEKTTEEKTESENEITTLEYEGKQGDSLQVIKKDGNGKVIESTTYTGGGKITATKGKIVNSTITSEKQNIALETKKHDTYSTSVKSEVDMTEINKLKQGRSYWWVWLLIGVCIPEIIRLVKQIYFR